MLSLDRLARAQRFARDEGMDLLDALEWVGPRAGRSYPRKASKRPVLPPRREGDPRTAARRQTTPRLTREDVEAGWLSATSARVRRSPEPEADGLHGPITRVLEPPRRGICDGAVRRCRATAIRPRPVLPPSRTGARVPATLCSNLRERDKQ